MKKSHRKGNSAKVKPPKPMTSKNRPTIGAPSHHAVAKASELSSKKIGLWLQESSALQKATRVSHGLDTWQEEAVALLRQRSNVIVDAPTTAGKTRVAEEFLRDNLQDPNFRAVYTTPVKSLANDKLLEFRELFGENLIGISTGDFKENLNAPIVVATLESYRNSLLGVEPDLGRNIAIFDEYHYIQDPGRGSAWEEALILTPTNCQVLLMSASVGNAETFREWLTSTHPISCELVKVEKRPVPLEDLVFFEGHWLTANELPAFALKSANKRVDGMPLAMDEICYRVAQLPSLQLSPCIIYVGKRLACENFAHTLRTSLKPLDEKHARDIKERLDLLDQKYRARTFLPSRLLELITRFGVAYHHSGLPAPARIAIENLLKDGLLNFCSATMGLSLGINFSVRSAVVSDYRRPDETGNVEYSASEITQMLGRAGRRGRDAVGFSCWPSVEAYLKFRRRNRAPCKSALRNDPATFLGLIGRGYRLADVEKFYRKSFLCFVNQTIDVSLVTADRVRRRLKAEQLPCSSPGEAFSAYKAKEPAPCGDCQFRKNCHEFIYAKLHNNFAGLHIHLHRIGALTSEEKLTKFGDIARFFPQDGGLILAEELTRDNILPGTLLVHMELAAALCLARFKQPFVPPDYEPPFDVEQIESNLEDLYPEELFPEAYDPPFGRRKWSVLRTFNPGAGYVMRRWLMGCDWDTLCRESASDTFGPGDAMNLMFRAGTYLQSIAQCSRGPLKEAAIQLRTVLIRDPLSLTLS